MWSAVRWHAFQVMAAMPYCDLQKAGIRNPSDLIKFPWDTEATGPSDEEVNELQQMLEEEIARMKETAAPK